MVSRSEIEFAVRIQERVYEFIGWLREARRSMDLRFDEVHVAMNVFDAARSWLANNAGSIPGALQPTAEERDAFVNMLCSFGMTSGGRDVPYCSRGFDRTGVDGDSSDGPSRCTCQFCSDLVWRLGNYSLSHQDRKGNRGARVLRLSALREIAEQEELPLVESDLEGLLALRGEFALASNVWTYATELVRRCKYDETIVAHQHLADGVLILWRRIMGVCRGRASLRGLLSGDSILRFRESVAVEMRRLVDAELGK